jgi:hypothetical protein
MTCAVGLSSPPVVILREAKDLLPVAIEKAAYLMPLDRLVYP